MSDPSAQQCGVVTRAQALAMGMPHETVRSRVRRGIWQRLHRRVYATFSGPVPRAAAIWGVVLAAGEGAALSHYTAAELAGLEGASRTSIHVTVPSTRRVGPIEGGVVHLSSRVGTATHPSRHPPRTRIEESVLDICELESSLDSALGWLANVCGQRLTTPSRLKAALDRRSRFRWRREVGEALGDLTEGSNSLLELKYVRDVEHSHHLPRSQRQAARERPGGRIYEDVNYEDFGVSVELDGQVAHPDRTRFRDLRRDNIATRRGDLVLHYGWDDVVGRPCDVAAEVAAVLMSNGWRGPARRCRKPRCRIA